MVATQAMIAARRFKKTDTSTLDLTQSISRQAAVWRPEPNERSMSVRGRPRWKLQRKNQPVPFGGVDAEPAVKRPARHLLMAIPMPEFRGRPEPIGHSSGMLSP